MQQIADRDKAAEEAEAEKMRMEMAAVGKALHAALARDRRRQAGGNALANIGAATPLWRRQASPLTPLPGRGRLLGATVDPAAVTLAAGDSVGSLGRLGGHDVLPCHGQRPLEGDQRGCRVLQPGRVCRSVAVVRRRV